MQNLKAQVFFLIRVKVGALNNAGLSKVSRNENVTATKKVFVDGNAYPYMAGQSFGRVLRDTLQRNFGWNMAPLLRGEKTVTMVANPFLYDDADMFGYLNAEKAADLDETGAAKKDSKNNDKMINMTVNRKGAISKRAIRSVGPLSIVRNWSSASRHEGNSIPYFKEEYGGNFEGGICVDCFDAGTFSDFNKTGYKNITDVQKDEALENGCTLIDHPYELNDKGLPQKLVRLPLEIRQKRITDVFRAGRLLSGGAMQSNNMEDISYNFVIYYTLSSGNHLFGNIMSERMDTIVENPEDSKEEIAVPLQGQTEGDTTVEIEKNIGHRPTFNKSRFILNVPAILEELWDYRQQIIGTVFIGKRMGFLDEYTESLKELVIYSGKERKITRPDGSEIIGQYPTIEFGTVGDMTDLYCEQLKTQIQ
jgi:CRISPR-associated protein Cst2